MVPGISDPASPNEPKAHLMIAYLKEMYMDNTTLLQVGARQGVENSTMKKDDNPKVLFERLTLTQFNYHGNTQANITDDDLVTQAVLYLQCTIQQ
jgi:hypothetical protein